MEAGSVRSLRAGSAVSIVLARPRKLNAITLEMARSAREALGRLSPGGGVACVILRGEGGRAFSAGGDVRWVHAQRAEEAGRVGPGQAEFFAELLALERTLADVSSRVCPSVALWDGIAMGGGASLGAFATFRVATERTLWALPEVAIGGLPPAWLGCRGATACPWMAVWAASTGAPLAGADAVHAGVATHFVPRDRVPALVARLEALPSPGDGAKAARRRVREALDAASAPASELPPPSFAASAPAMRACFVAGETSRGQLLSRLRLAAAEADSAADSEAGAGAGWAADAARALGKASPDAVQGALALLNRAASLSWDEAHALTYSATVDRCGSPAFRMGVQSVMVDKAGPPAWPPCEGEEAESAASARVLSAPDRHPAPCAAR